MLFIIQCSQKTLAQCAITTEEEHYQVNVRKMFWGYHWGLRWRLMMIFYFFY